MSQSTTAAARTPRSTALISTAQISTAGVSTARRAPGPARRRSVAVAAGLASLTLVLASCGTEGTAEDALGSATSAMGSAAAQASSAAAQATSAVGEATSRVGAGGDGSLTPDQEFLRDIRAVGVNADDEQDYLTRGRDACASLDGGAGYVDVTRQYNDAHPGAPITEAPVVVAAAVKAFCSQHLPQLGRGEGGN
ncbi:MAG TPA: DUF732 domain-containing protein [Dietzia sp.]|nr:DUF732 domain-containing protein [Dietzia sp.]